MFQFTGENWNIFCGSHECVFIYHGRISILEAAVQAAQESRELRRAASLQLVVQPRARGETDAARATVTSL